MTTYAAELGVRIRQARESARLTQADLAQHLGLSRSSVANIERGAQGDVSAEQVVVIGDALETDHRWLLTGRGLVPDHVRRQPINPKSVLAVADELVAKAAELRKLAGEL